MGEVCTSVLFICIVICIIICSNYDYHNYLASCPIPIQWKMVQTLTQFEMCVNSGPYKDWVQQFRCCIWAKFRSTFHIIDMYLKLLNHSCGSSTYYVFSDVTFSSAHVISWLHQAPPSTYSNILNAACGICASRITELFPDQDGLFHLPRVLADGNNRYLGCYWQMCHSHYPFDPPV